MAARGAPSVPPGPAGRGGGREGGEPARRAGDGTPEDGGHGQV